MELQPQLKPWRSTAVDSPTLERCVVSRSVSLELSFRCKLSQVSGGPMYVAASMPCPDAKHLTAADGGRTLPQATETAFRREEKRYQLHRDPVIKSKGGKRRGGKLAVRPTDLSALVDVDAAAGASGVEGVQVHRQPAPAGLPPGAAAFAFPRHPGLLLVREALSSAQQWQLVVDALTVFPEPPSHSNLYVGAGAVGSLPDLWEAAQRGLRLARQPSQHLVSPPEVGAAGARWAANGPGPTAASLLRRLRWATLGPPYDWTQRVYRRDERYSPLPSPLRQLALTLAGAAGERRGAGAGRAYDPDAALVNYYYGSDTLGGHVDDAEADLSQPIVSLSLGCPAVLLMGGETRDLAPTPLLLRSGDAIVLAGPARRCYHGLPRIFTHPLPDALPATGGGGGGPGSCICGGGDAGGPVLDERLAPFAEHMKGCRINISIRATT